jgi:hypothetical protein
MSITSSTATTQRQGVGAKLRNTAVGVLFALARLAPKLLRLRRDAYSWLVFRIVLGVAGATLVVVPLGLWNSWITAIMGLAMFTASILLPPAKPDTRADEKARELGALLVVNGGIYQPGNAPAAPVQLFAGTQRVWALDPNFQPLLVIPAGEISSVRAEESEGRWVLRIHWTGHTAEFFYRGIFAEHLVRIAENAIGSLLRTSLPVLPQRRAASA